eukprot:403338406
MEGSRTQRFQTLRSSSGLSSPPSFTHQRPSLKSQISQKLLLANPRTFQTSRDVSPVTLKLQNQGNLFQQKQHDKSPIRGISNNASHNNLSQMSRGSNSNMTRKSENFDIWKISKNKESQMRELKNYKQKIKKLLEDKKSQETQIGLLQYEISMTQNQLKEVINDFNEQAFFDISKLTEKILKQKEVKNILKIFCDSLNILEQTKTFDGSTFTQTTEKSRYLKYDLIIDKMSLLTRDLDKQIDFFKSTDLASWDQLLEIWKQKPNLDRSQSRSNINRSSQSSEKSTQSDQSTSSDYLRGLQIICRWICGLIEIHFKMQAINFVKRKLDKIDQEREEIDVQYHKGIACVKEANEKLLKHKQQVEAIQEQRKLQNKSGLFRHDNRSNSNSSSVIGFNSSRQHYDHQSTNISSRFERSIGESDFRQLNSALDSRSSYNNSKKEKQQKITKKTSEQLLKLQNKSRMAQSQQDKNHIFRSTDQSMNSSNLESFRDAKSLPNFIKKPQTATIDLNIETKQQPMHQLPFQVTVCLQDLAKQANYRPGSLESTLNQEAILDALQSMDQNLLESLINTKAQNSIVVQHSNQKKTPAQSLKYENKDLPVHNLRQKLQQVQQNHHKPLNEPILDSQQTRDQREKITSNYNSTIIQKHVQLQRPNESYHDEISFYDVDLRIGMDGELDEYQQMRMQKLIELRDKMLEQYNKDQECKFFCM